MDHIAAQLAEKSFSVTPDFFSAEEIFEIRADLAASRKAGLFKRAGISTGAKVNDEVRRDEIFWLEGDGHSRDKITARALLLTRMEDLRQSLNRQLFLGLRTFEGHYAHYPAGAFYRRHLDRFSEKSDRTVSVCLYLNENWRESDGGKLRLYTADAPVDVEPRAGTLACFLSAEVEHEVLESQAERMSFTGWFKT